MDRESGFTLLELMVALALTAILLTIAVPSFTTMMRNNRGVSDANALLGMMLLARSEAIRRNVTVEVCTSTDGNSCDNSLTDWAKGVIVLADPSGTPHVVKVAIPLSDASVIHSSLSTPSVQFSSQGLASSAGHFTVQPSGGTVGQRDLMISVLGGRMRVCDPTSDASCPTS